MYKLLKIDQWWSNKISPLLCFIFLGISHYEDVPTVASLSLQLVLFIVSCIGIAGFGHLFLDAFDSKEDRLNGKTNGWLLLGNVKGIISLIFIFITAWAPLYFLPNWSTVKWLVAAEFLLFVLYAVPPLRCKERGIAGIFIDGLYGYVVPSLVAWTIFSPEPHGVMIYIYPLCLLLWLLPKGMRHILRHQYYDIDADKRAGLGTFAVRYGRAVTLSLIKHYLLPVELIATVLALILLSWPNPLPVMGLFFFFAWEWRVLRHQWLQPVPPIKKWKPVEWSEWMGMRFLTTFTELLLPLIALCVVLFRHPNLWPLTFIFILVCGRSMKMWWNEVSPLILKRFNDVKL